MCGGAPFNVALTMSRLGSPTAFLSNVSEDMFGDKICAELEANSVDLSMVKPATPPRFDSFFTRKVERVSAY